MNQHRDDATHQESSVPAPSGDGWSPSTDVREEPTSERKNAGRPRPLYDPAFRRAVAAGLLTAHEAARRGRRSDYAARIAAEHHLPLRLAQLVADDAISVDLACRQLAELDQATTNAARRTRVRRAVHTMIAVAGGAALVLAGATWMLTMRRVAAPTAQSSPASSVAAAAPAIAAWKPQANPPAPLWRLVRTTTDDGGQPTKLSGPDPESVLRAFCHAAPAGAEVTPVGLSSAIPPQAAVRWGVYRTRFGKGFVQGAIVIRHDSETLKWTTGDGQVSVFKALGKEGPMIFPHVESLGDGASVSRGAS